MERYCIKLSIFFLSKLLENYASFETNVILLVKVVNEQHGAEEYVHLKSLEDEIHFMDSTMPPKEHGPDDCPKGPPPEQHEGGEEAPPADVEERRSMHRDQDDHTHQQEADIKQKDGTESEQQENQKPKKNRDYLFEPSPSLDEREEEDIIQDANVSNPQDSNTMFYETQRFSPSDLQPPQPSSKGISRRDSQESLHDIDE